MDLRYMNCEDESGLGSCAVLLLWNLRGYGTAVLAS